MVHTIVLLLGAAEAYGARMPEGSPAALHKVPTTEVWSQEVRAFTVPGTQRGVSGANQSNSSVETVPKIIWSYWDNPDRHTAGYAAKKAWATWELHNPNWKLIVVSNASIFDYVEPTQIKPKMTIDAKIERVKLALLHRYGGVWADPSVACMAPLDDWLWRFMHEGPGYFMCGTRQSDSATRSTDLPILTDRFSCLARYGNQTCSFFMASVPKSRMTTIWNRLAEEYWKKRERVCDADGDPKRSEPAYLQRCVSWADSLLLDFLNTDEDTDFRDEFTGRPTLPCRGGCSPQMFYEHGCEDHPNAPLSVRVRKCFQRLVPPHVAKLTLHESCDYPALGEGSNSSNGHKVLVTALGEDNPVDLGSTNAETEHAITLQKRKNTNLPPINASCLAKDTTTACLLTNRRVSSAAAFEQCYRPSREVITTRQEAKRVLVADLKAGDEVLTLDNGGRLASTRVIVNQHAEAELTSHVLTVRMTDGSTLSLTPDHALFVDGTLAAANDVAIGSVLSKARGEAATVEHVAGRDHTTVINPITVAGTILASDEGAPVLVSTHPIYTASIFLAGSYPMPLCLCSLLSFFFPAASQAYYDAWLEPLFSAISSDLMRIKAAIPHAVAIVGIRCLDAVLALGFCAFALLRLVQLGLVLVVSAWTLSAQCQCSCSYRQRWSKACWLCRLRA